MKTLTKSTRIQSYTMILVLISLFYHQNSFSQYSLPNSATLSNNNIKAIHVTKTPVREENARKKDISKKSFDRTPQLLTSYFISHSGRIDSVYRYYHDITKHHTHIFRFGLDNQLQEIKVSNADGEVTKRRLLEKTPENEFHLRNWSDQVLTYDLKIIADSTIRETTIYQSFSPTVIYTKTRFDFDAETKTICTYEENDLVMKETYQWFANDLGPYSFTYTKNITGKRTTERKTTVKEYQVASDGSIMSENKGLFTDPFASINYFDRYDYFKGIQHPFANLLRADNLVSQSESSEVISFDGTCIVYAYSMDYERY